MSICEDKKRGTFYISYKYKTPLGDYKTVNIKNNAWKTSGVNKVTKRYMNSIEKSIIDEDKAKRGLNYHEGDSVTLSQAIQLYLTVEKADGIQETTLINEKSTFKNYLINQFQPNIQLDKVITVSNMDKVKLNLTSSDKLSVKSKNIKLTYLRNFVKFTRKRKLVSRANADDVLDILESVRDNEHKLKKENYFTHGDEDVNKFFDSFNEVDNEYKIYFQTLFYSALRIGEFCAITYDDIDFENNTIKITKQIYENGKIAHRTKNGLDKIVLLPSQLMTKLKEYVEEKYFYGDDLIFTSKNGCKLNRGEFQKIMDKHCVLAGIERITLHGLRHTFATRMFERDCSVKDAQLQLGHKSMSTTMNIYLHYTENKDKNRNDNLY